MKKLLVVVDMQNDFIDGALANPEAQKIINNVAEYIKNFDGTVVATRDTHNTNYADTQEGKKLPVPHCIKDTQGWKINATVQNALTEKANTQIVNYIDKPVFGSIELGEYVKTVGYDEAILIGVCTDICVISNAMVIRAFSPETNITVVKDLCAGVTPESHETAITAMKACQIDII